MNSLERVVAVYKGEISDRTPVIPIVGQAAAVLNGMTISEELKSAETLAESRITCLKKFGYDGIYISADTWVTAEAMGAKVIQPPNAPAEGTEPLIKNKKDLDKLKPVNPLEDGRCPLLIEATRIAVKKSKDSFAVIGNFDQSPFSLACALRGINEIMIDLYDSPTFVEKLLEITTESTINYAKAMAKAGAHILNTGDSPAGLIGPENYAKYALPYEKIMFDELQALGKPSVLHICGDTTELLPQMATSGADGLELDYQVNLVKARKVIGDYITIIGNLNPVRVMLEGSPEIVKQEATNLLDQKKQIGKFILSTGCTIAPNNPPENLKAIAETVL